MAEDIAAEDWRIVGRGTDCDIRVHDPFVSIWHCKVIITPGPHCLVEDLGSNTGVVVNGEKVYGQTEVFPGDEVRIGRTDLIALLVEHAEEFKAKRARIAAQPEPRQVHDPGPDFVMTEREYGSETPEYQRRMEEERARFLKERSERVGLHHHPWKRRQPTRLDDDDFLLD